MVSEDKEFRITISPKSEQGYLVLITAPVTFGKPTDFLPIDIESQEFQKNLARVREDRSGNQFLQEFGSLLFDNLLPGKLAVAYELSREHAESSGTGILRITLQILAPELHGLPWEIMYHKVHKTWFCTNRLSPMSRFVNTPGPASVKIRLPLRILICTAEPSDLPSPAADREATAVQSALDPLRREGAVEMRVLEGVGRESLRKILEQFRPHLFHFIGHGIRQGDHCGLALEKTSGKSDLIPAELLLELLRQPGSVRASILSACNSDGLALALAQQGLTSIGTLYRIRSHSATHFFGNLYEALAAGASLDAAVNCARFAVRLECGADQRDWWLPVVFLAEGKARLFEIERPTKMIQVLSSPPGARILLDEIPTGKMTPDAVVIVDNNPHTIRVDLAGHEPAVPQEVTSSFDESPSRLEFVLRRKADGPIGSLPSGDQAPAMPHGRQGRNTLNLLASWKRLLLVGLLIAFIPVSFVFYRTVVKPFGVPEQPKGEGPKEVPVIQSDAGEMVLIPAGTLRKGPWDTSVTGALIRKYGLSAGGALVQMLQSPQRTVKLDDYLIDKYEVSNARYRVFLDYIKLTNDHSQCHPDEPAGKDHTPKYWSNSRFNQDDQPVIGIDWFDAYAYARWAGKRLPSEEEWEFAACGPEKYIYPWGNTYSEVSYYGGSEITGPLPVSMFPAERNGAPVGMGGNISEWTASGKGTSGEMIFRGGAWNHSPGDIYGLTFLRFYADRAIRDDDLGFRCARDIDTEETDDEMIRVTGGTVRLGGENTPLLDLLRRLNQQGKNTEFILKEEQGTVQIGSFLMDKYEVTNAQYRVFLDYIKLTNDHSRCHPDEPAGKDYTPAYWSDSRFNQDDQPVVGVDFYDAYAYAAWAGKRLPSGDEWEMAARGQTKNLYPWGDVFDPSRCVCNESSHDRPAQSNLLDCSPCGIFDLAGNVMEWTTDLFGGSLSHARSLRGGAWSVDCEIFGLTYLRQIGANPLHRDTDVGFRCVMEVKESDFATQKAK